MTTIACDGRTMAGDGNTYTNGTLSSANTVKVKRLSDGSLYGACGGGGDEVKHLQWLEAQKESVVGDCPKLDDGFGFLLLKPDGQLLQGACDGIPGPIEKPFAIGSGMDYAIGAMDGGLTPENAIKVASRRDKATGGLITVLELWEQLPEGYRIRKVA